MEAIKQEASGSEKMATQSSGMQAVQASTKFKLEQDESSRSRFRSRKTANAAAAAIDGKSIGHAEDLVLGKRGI
uniref:Uncharacterized protein n=1 Tax=Mycena chlorophos TaxID=658473 RepID=A0ABQ0MA92_MYCCL|nr:predicted protein [Mycena chlorophos]